MTQTKKAKRLNAESRLLIAENHDTDKKHKHSKKPFRVFRVLRAFRDSEKGKAKT